MFFVSKQPHLYEDADCPYKICECLGIAHRGPAIDISQRYICCVGNSYTFGRFVSRPYPEILSELAGVQVLNLGFGHLTPLQLNRNPILKKLMLGAWKTVAQFRFDGSVLEVQSEIKLNWGSSIIEGALNVPFCPNPVRSNQHYPSQDSHVIMAELLKSLLI